MSQTTPDELPQLNLREIITRIDRQREEAQKFSAEREKLIAEREKLAAEREKLAAEREKLFAESIKLNRDYRFAPYLMLTAAIGSLAAAVAAIITLLRFTNAP